MPDVNGFLTPNERQALAQERLANFKQMEFYGIGFDAFCEGLRKGLEKGYTTTDSIGAGLDNAYAQLRKRRK